MIAQSETKYFHISYEPESGWILSIMTRLSQSTNSQLRQTFENWSKTSLREFGFAITTRIQMLGLCIRRLNARVGDLRKSLGGDERQLQDCLDVGYAFRLKDNNLAYEVLLDMDSFIFESRSLYEIVGKFLCSFLEIVLTRKIGEKELQSVLTAKTFDTRWIGTLRESRKLFFHETAPWLAIQVDSSPKRFYPILMKRNVVEIGENPNEFVSFEELREIYEGFVNSLSGLHEFVLEEIRLFESLHEQG